MKQYKTFKSQNNDIFFIHFQVQLSFTRTAISPTGELPAACTVERPGPHHSGEGPGGGPGGGVSGAVALLVVIANHCLEEGKFNINNPKSDIYRTNSPLS